MHIFNSLEVVKPGNIDFDCFLTKKERNIEKNEQQFVKN